MKTLCYRMIPEGKVGSFTVPLNIVFLDLKDITAAGLSPREAIEAIAQTMDGPAGFNVFDMDCVTTTSDGLMVEGAIVVMGASDHRRVNPDFGILEMEEIPWSKELVQEEPHLKQWGQLYPGKRLFRGPNPAKKMIPVHNVVITGRASNNNSATEMMNIVTMDEILLPILGQLEIMRDGDILMGYTGEVISVGIGMTVAEKFGRVFPTRQFHAGETAHNCGAYAKTLKKTIPCMVADKPAFAKYILRALACGMIPGVDIGCSPAVLTVAHYLGSEIGLENIQPSAWEELSSVGITREWLSAPVEHLSPEEIIQRASEIIPGVEQAVPLHTTDFVEKRSFAL